MSDPIDIVDIHAHLWPKDWGPGKRPGLGLGPEIERRILDPQALLADLDEGGVALAVLSTTTEGLFGAVGDVDGAIVDRTNDWLAGLVAAHPGRIAAFGTVDPFSGDEGARQAERALGELNLSGLVIDSSRQGLFLADPRVRPTLEVAARYKAPIFVHPVAAPNADILVAGAGRLGNSHGRGLMNGVAFLSVLESDILDAFPDLNFIFATLGFGAVVQAARGGRYGREARQAGRRPNIYFDTMGDDPAIVRLLVDFFGAERIVAGTDWPIMHRLTGEGLREAASQDGLGDAELRLIAGGNARRILRA